MFFQFSPPARPTKKPVKKETKSEDSILSLAPFTPNPKIFFEDINVGQTATQRLIIQNPTKQSVELTARITVSENINVQLNWYKCRIDPQGKDFLELVWTPTCEGSWRFILHITDAKRIWKEVPVVFKSVILKGNKNGTKKRLPRFVVKKNTSPNFTYKRKSPRKRPVLPNITNIPSKVEIPPENCFNGKENFNFSPNFNLNIDIRRETYTINSRNIPQIEKTDPVFDDSLENAVKSPSASFEKRLQSESFGLSTVLTPRNAGDFNPDCCSTDEKSINSTSSYIHVKPKSLLFDETYEIVQNISTETYIKGNSSSETFTKSVLSPNISDLDVFSSSPSFYSKKLRQDSLVGNGVKATIEADFWSNTQSRPLLTIKEETNVSQISNQTLKRKSDITFSIISPKRPNRSFPQDWTKQPTTFVFDTEHVAWLEAQEDNFKKWLNAVLTPPIDLDSNEESHPLDVAKLWRECKKREVETAPSRETVSNRFHNNTKLNILRKAAREFYRSPSIQNVLAKVWAAVDSNRLAIRTDRDVHLDLALQADVMQVLLSYNPLWLRIGLETIYGQVIPLSSNSDIIGLTTFLWERFMRDPALLKKYKTIHSQKYCTLIKQFILKKFLALIYFLDRAKTHKLIAHDPCLFCKNAPIKESREALLKFSRDTLSSMGDITKYLKHFNYIVEHKQTYLNEFDYAVNCLGVDLRDGVRLTRVMEVILLEKDLSKNLRVPTISRLQKIHNMKIVFDAIQKSGFELIHDITPTDIVNGHKEKTLSFLWQLIYKFQTPLMAKSVTIISQWWRSKRIIEKREKLRQIRAKRNSAARKIQSWFRCIHIMTAVRRLLRRQKAAIKIQSYVRMFLVRRWHQKLKYCVLLVERTYLAKKERENFELLKYAVLVIQRRFRAVVAGRKQRLYFETLRYTTILIQRRFRAKRSARINYNYYQKLKRSAILVQKCFKARKQKKEFDELKAVTLIIQRRWRANLAMRKENVKYQVLRETTIMIQRRFRAKLAARLQICEFRELKAVVIFVQRKWRAKLAMRTERIKFQVLKTVVVTIQRRFRAKIVGRRDFVKYNQLKKCVLFVQRKWRAKLLMRQELYNYQTLKASAIIIQRRFRATIIARLQYKNFNKLKSATVTIQRRFRAKILGRKEFDQFNQLRKYVLFVQRKWRAKLLMRQQVFNYQRLKANAIVVQRRFRAAKIARLQNKSFIELKSATITIQRRFRAKIMGRKDFDKFNELRKCVLLVQRKWRAKRLMRQEVSNYQKFKASAIVVQRWFRATKIARLQYNSFIKLKCATVTIQMRFRAKIIGRRDFNKFNEMRKCVLLIQRKWRAKRLMKQEMYKYQTLKATTIVVQRRFRVTRITKLQYKSFNELKSATITIQRRFRAKILGRREFDQFNKLRKCVLFVQTRWRAKLLMRQEVYKYQKLKTSAIVVQRRFRATKIAKLQCKSFNELKSATVTIQRRFRAQLVGRRDFNQFNQLKKCVLLIQRKWRAKRLMRQEMCAYQRLKSSAIVVQRRFRATKTARLQYKNYNELKCATITIQRRFRAQLVGRKELNQYNQLRKCVLVVQRKWRATLLMKQERPNYQTLKKSTMIIQRWFRATKMAQLQNKSFNELKSATITIQRHFRAHLLRKRDFNYFNQLRKCVLFVQRKWRAKLFMRQEIADYQALKASTIVVQRRFRANKIARLQYKTFNELKSATITIQRRFRAQLVARRDFTQFNQLRKCVLFVQRKWRAERLMRQEMLNYQRFKTSAVVIQRRFRALIARKTAQNDFISLKKAAKVIQNKWRATIAMRNERQHFEDLKRVTIFVQRRYRMKISLREVLKRKRGEKACIILQKYIRGFLVRRKYSDYLTPEAIAKRREMRKKNFAATQIQAFWRGYKLRQSQGPELDKIYKRLNEANANAQEQNTLGSRCKKAVLQLVHVNLGLKEMLRVMEDLDFITRRCKQSCLKFGNLLPNVLYDTVTSTNRSPPEIKICTAVISILINFYRFEPTRKNTWIPEYMDQLTSVMLHSCDKETPLFSTLCTLIWFFSHNEEYKNVIIASPNFAQKMTEICKLTGRKEKMIAKMNVKYHSFFSQYKNLPLPSMTPDWGLEYKERPKTFGNSIHALNCLRKTLSF